MWHLGSRCQPPCCTTTTALPFSAEPLEDQQDPREPLMRQLGHGKAPLPGSEVMAAHVYDVEMVYRLPNSPSTVGEAPRTTL